jgi:hypothetical protein
MVIPISLELVELEARLIETNTEQAAVILARNYFNGVQEVYLTTRAKEFLGIHGDHLGFRLNVCRTIVTAVAGELNILGFDTNEQVEDGGKKEQAEWAAELYDKNKIDSLQDTIHEAALSDSETFVIVEWDDREKRSRLIHNPRYVSPEAGGEGVGVWMIYENDDRNQRPVAAVKQWIETEFIQGGTPRSVTRRTVYYPERIERWIFDNGAWSRFYEPGEFDPETGEVDFRPAVIDWTQGDEPIGIPVFHFRNKGDRPEHWDAIPIQDAINKTLVDALGSADLTAFKSFFGFGFYPTTDGEAPKEDGTNVFKMGPAQWNGTMTPSDQASLQVIEGSDPSPLMNQLKDLVMAAAQITDTPVSRFIITGAIASEKTIKEQDRGLRKKAGDRRGLFSDPWVGAVTMARKLENIFGDTELSEEILFSPIWEHTETLEELAEKKTTLEIPIEQLWREAGYDQAQIESMKKEPSYRIAFEKLLWEGWNQASLSGLPLEAYLRRAGLKKEEVSEILKDIENQQGTPPVDL